MQSQEQEQEHPHPYLSWSMPKYLAQDTCTNATDSLAHHVALKTPNEGENQVMSILILIDGRHGYHEPVYLWRL